MKIMSELEFEDKFSELQVDMISICMEYIEDRADKVYVYASCEEKYYF